MNSKYRNAALVVLCLLWSPLLYAAKTLDHGLTEIDHLRSGALSFEVEDMKVKVQGGFIRQVRTWKGGHWQFNQRWESIRASDRAGATVPLVNVAVRRPDACGVESIPASGSLTRIIRNGALYQRTSTSANYYRVIENGNGLIVEYDSWIEPDGQSNLIWRNRDGQWIRYNASGDITAYGTRNNDTVSFRYDQHGNIAGVLDVHGTEVMTFEYTAHTRTLSKPLPNGGTSVTVYLLTKATDDFGREVSYTYDANQFLVAVTDVRGEQWQYQYDSRGHLSGMVDPLDRVTSITVDANGLVSSIKDADGVGATYEYGGAAGEYRQLRRGTDGKVVETWYNRLGRQTRQAINGEVEFEASYLLGSSATAPTLQQPASVEVPTSRADVDVCDTSAVAGAAPNGEISTAVETLGSAKRQDRYGEEFEIKYDQWGNEIERRRKSDGAVRTAQYHPVFNVVTEKKNWNGVITRYTYDSKGNLASKTEAVGKPEERTTSYTWDQHGNRTLIKYHGDTVTLEASYIYTYDARGNVTSIASPAGTIHFVDAEYPQHGALGNEPVRIDESGKRWRVVYDLAGNAIAGIDPLNRTASNGYNAAGDHVSTSAPNGSATSWTVNHVGSPLETTDALGNKAKVSYDKAGRAIQWESALGTLEMLGYNASGLVAREVDAMGNTIEYGYEGARAKTVQFPTYIEELEHDVKGNLLRSLTKADDDEIQQHRQYDYDAFGNPVVITDAEGKQTRADLDSYSRIILTTDATGGTTLFTYDSRDNLLTVTDPQGSTTTFGYDAADRLISETYPGGQVRSYSYFPNGLRHRETNPKGEITQYQYDDSGQLTGLQYFTGATALQNNQPGKTVSFQYDALGQLNQYNDGTTSGTYTYTLLGQLESVAVNYGPFTKSHSYTYDADGRKKTYTNPEGITYTYGYNANGDFQSLTIPDEGTIAVTGYRWRSPAEWLFPGGTRLVTETDGLLRPSQTILLDPGSNPHSSRLYTYNAENHITGIQTKEGMQYYTLDGLYRMSVAAYQYNEQLQKQAQQGLTTLLESEQYSYDASGNRLSDHADANGEHWQYNVNHQLIAQRGITYAYDANGHTIEQTDSSNGTTRQFEYDLAERLSVVSHVSQSGSTVLGQYSYDPFGRRIRKVTQTESLYFHYDDTGLLAEYDANGILLKEYHYTPGSAWMTNPLFLRDAGSNTLHYYYNSHIGQPLKLFVKDGRVSWQGRSQAFGDTEVLIHDVDNKLRFPGQYFDWETGLHHNYHRYYDPSVGRYIQRDPIGLSGGINAFVYANNNPISYFDFNGLMASNCWKVPQGSETKTSSETTSGEEFVRWRKTYIYPKPGDVLRRILRRGKKPPGNNPPLEWDSVTVIQWGRTYTTTVTVEVWVNGYMRCEEEGPCGEKEYEDFWISPWLASSDSSVSTETVNTRKDYEY